MSSKMTYNICEKKFQEWLNEKKYPYIFIDQSRETFSTLFGNVETKRPDFLLVLQQLGIIAVNIKDYITVGWEDGIQRIFNF